MNDADTPIVISAEYAGAVLLALVYPSGAPGNATARATPAPDKGVIAQFFNRAGPAPRTARFESIESVCESMIRAQIEALKIVAARDRGRRGLRPNLTLIDGAE